LTEPSARHFRRIVLPGLLSVLLLSGFLVTVGLDRTRPADSVSAGPSGDRHGAVGLLRPAQGRVENPVDRSARGPRVIVHPGSLRRHDDHQLRHVAEAAVRQVSAVFPHGWPDRVAVTVPSDVLRFRAMADGPGGSADVAAVALPRRGSVGRVLVDPAVWRRMSAAGRVAVLCHEFTHVATAQMTGRATPRWLSEGIADWVGFRRTSLATARIAAALRARIRSHGVPHVLPADRAFTDAGLRRRREAYDEGWFAARAIARHWGVPALVQFYRAVGSRPWGQRAAVTEATRWVLHTSVRRLVDVWRADMRTDLRPAG
jgi:hypothetical protein